VFAVVQRPLTLGDLQGQLDGKLAYARELRSPKVMILAGSNGRYSHRCAELSQALDRPCVNASIASAIRLDFLLDQFGALLLPGDILYLPLEYEQYGMSAPQMQAGAQNAVLLRAHPSYLWSLPADQIVAAYGAFDLPFLIRGLAEMALAHGNFKRRTGIDTLTPQGDERGHSAEKARLYADYVRQAPPPDTRIAPRSDAQDVLAAFLRSARARGITVVGGLPTVPDDTPIAEADIERIRHLFVANGQRFVRDETASRYPRSCFFDAVYHLDEEWQGRHSQRIAQLLKEVVPGSLR
jgi:hypothetical protein